MNWGRIVMAGGAAGIVVSLVDYVLHGMIMSGTYARYPSLFVQEEGNPIWFFVVNICVAILACALFAKTRSCWSQGLSGGATYGFWLGMVAFFSNFFWPLVLVGFPYFLAWCWGGINLIDAVVGGAVLGLLYKE